MQGLVVVLGVCFLLSSLATCLLGVAALAHRDDAWGLLLLLTSLTSAVLVGRLARGGETP